MKLTRQKLKWFEQMLEAIEERATFVTDYVGRVKTPSIHKERLHSLDVGNDRFPGETVVKKYIRGDWNNLTFPTEVLYNDAALVRYRQDKEDAEARRAVQENEAQQQEALRTLRKLAEKYPQFFEGDTLKGD